MPKRLPPSTPELNRLRAAAALIPVIESGLADSKLSADKVALMASFFAWAVGTSPGDADAVKLSESICQGLDRLKVRLAASG